MGEGGRGHGEDSGNHQQTKQKKNVSESERILRGAQTVVSGVCVCICVKCKKSKKKSENSASSSEQTNSRNFIHAM